MNAPAFTPGPWVVREDEFEGFCVHAPTIERMTDCWYVVVSNVNGDSTKRPKYGTPKANANLIAAAPELYEALDGLRTAMACHDSTPEEFLALANAVAALAKAVQS